MLITPEHDQSTVTQWIVYDEIGETMVCHKSVKIAAIATIDQMAFTGGAIDRKMATIRIDDTKMITRATTVVDEIEV